MRLVNSSGLVLIAAISAPFVATSAGSAWVVYTKEQWLRGAGLLGAELAPSVVARSRALIAELDVPRLGPGAVSRQGLRIVVVSPDEELVAMPEGASVLPVRTPIKE